MDASGNPITPEELLVEMAWLRRLASRMASEVGLAEDAVQETLLAAVRRGPSVRGNLRGWLGSVLRNALRRRALHDRRLEAREEIWARSQDWNRHEPLDVSERFALEHDLSRAVHGLDQDLRTVVLLRFLEGRSLREISERVHAPISTVDARLTRALTLLRWRLERSHGDGAEGEARFRAALLLYLGRTDGASSAGPRVPWTVPWHLGALVSGVAGLLAVLAVFVTSTSEPRLEPGATRAASASGPDPASDPVADATRPDAENAARAPIPNTPSLSLPSSPTSSPMGSAEIRLVDAAQDPLEGVFVALWPEESAHPFPPPQQTAADGRVLFTGLPPGAYSVATDRLLPHGIEVRSDARTSATFAARGPEISGVVLDEFGTPLADALVWASAVPGGAYYEGAWTRGVIEDVATTRTDSQGRFRLAACGAVRLLGARASGRAPTPPQRFAPGRESSPGTRLVLAGEGGTLEGLVLAPDGTPLPDAAVFVEAFERNESTWPLLATRSDATGGFRLEGLATGERSVTVRAAGLAAWRGSARVGARAVASLEARLVPGAHLHGVVRDDAGQPVAGAEVRCSSATRNEPAFVPATICRSRADGSYGLTGLAPGDSSLLAQDATDGRTRIDLVLAPGEERQLDLFLDPAREVRGLLLDQGGEPVEGVVLILGGGLSNEVARSSTDANGRFVLSVFGPGELTLRGFEGAWPVLEERIEGPSADLRCVLADHTRPSAFLRGRINAAGGRLLLRSTRHPDHSGLEVRTGADGRFEAGPLPPGEFRLAWVGTECTRTLDPGVVSLVAGEVRELGECLVLEPGIVALDPEGCGTGPLRALVRSADGRIVAHSEIERSDSPAHLSLAGASYTLQLWSQTCAPRTLALEVRDGEVTELRSRLESGTPCEILLENPAGPRLRSLELTLENAAGEQLLAAPLHPSLDLPGGGYRLKIGLQPGLYGIHAAFDERRVLASAFTVEAKAQQLIRLELE